jgi:nicotinamide mononucleotide transporter
MTKYIEYTVGIVGSVLLIAASLFRWLPVTLTETLGFVTGAWCVWLTVKQNIWCWPLGIANNIFFIFLFAETGLYGDMGLQFVYIVLGGLGWYWWLYGGAQRSTLRVNRTGGWHLLIVVGLVALATPALMQILTAVNGSAPFLDSLTTTMSLAAQYMLTRKFIESWYVWLAVDVIYIGLYIKKELYLTALLYLIFIGLCVAGLIQWRKSLKANADAPTIKTDVSHRDRDRDREREEILTHG